MTNRILVVDDERSLCELVDTALKLRGYTTTLATSAADALHELSSSEFDVVLTDVRMPGTTGLELCERIVALRPGLPVVVMTAFGNLDTAVAAIRAGAFDFITKPFEVDLLNIVIDRAARHRQLSQQLQRLERQLENTSRFGDRLLGASSAMQHVFDRLAKVAATDASILITGESGTGKELAARVIHDHSLRTGRPFVAVNCAALPEPLLESELFGHARGAYTDAKDARKGLFLEADEGTLFLDEIGEMPPTMQVKLLRTLEESKVRPVGSDKEVSFNVRLITATNRDLESAIEQQRFRDDLFYRINVIQLELPPLRSRGTDVLLLAHDFVDRFAQRNHKPVTGLSEPAAEKLLAYSWPGNVRELRNVIERAVALTSFDKITVEDLPEKIQDFRGSQLFVGGTDPAELLTMEEVEKRYLLHVVHAVNNNRTLAARILGFDRKTLYRKLKAYGLADDED
ncbi:MAG: sigma-54 dependent transcriptional regulator [Pirellulaceae bacterium]|nr:sigma-54-dependent Fis family transcriptional regulator [Planctomycetales bacterium]